MIKTKKILKRINNLKTKKNLKGGGRNVGNIKKIDSIPPSMEPDLSGLEPPPPPIPEVDYDNFSDVFSDYDLLCFYKNEPPGLCDAVCDSSDDETNKKKKINNLTTCYNHIKVNYNKPYLQTSVVTECSKDYIESEINDDMDRTISCIHRNYDLENKLLSYAFFHGEYDDSCEIKQLPDDVSVCFLTRFNNYGVSYDNYDLISELVKLKETNKNAFKDIFDYKAYLLEGRNDLNNIGSYRNIILKNCFRFGNWYYPGQFYLDNKLYSTTKNSYNKCTNFSIVIRGKGVESITESSISYSLDKSFKLSKFILNLKKKYPNTEILIMGIVCRGVTNLDLTKIENINSYFGYEFLMNRINITLQKNLLKNKNPTLDLIKIPTIKLYCDSMSKDKDKILLGRQFKYYNYSYDNNYSLNISVLNYIYNKLKINKRINVPSQMFLHQLSHKKFYKFLIKLSEEEDQSIIEYLINKLLINQEFLYKIDYYNRAYTRFFEKINFSNDLFFLETFYTFINIRKLFGLNKQDNLRKLERIYPYICCASYKKITLTQNIINDATVLDLYNLEVKHSGKQKELFFEKVTKCKLLKVEISSKIKLTEENITLLELDNTEYLINSLFSSYINLETLKISKIINLDYNLLRSLIKLKVLEIKDCILKQKVIDILLFNKIKEFSLINTNVEDLYLHNLNSYSLRIENNGLLKLVCGSSICFNRLFIDNNKEFSFICPNSSAVIFHIKNMKIFNILDLFICSELLIDNVDFSINKPTKNLNDVSKLILKNIKETHNIIFEGLDNISHLEIDNCKFNTNVFSRLKLKVLLKLIELQYIDNIGSKKEINEFFDTIPIKTKCEISEYVYKRLSKKNKQKIR